ncbi:MAG: bifunctional folylpolyglutamate synthase/dihydrofolate synthase [Butyricicoccaceae bacterium]
MNQQQAKEYLTELSGSGIVLGLESIRELLRRLGNPQDHLKFVHAAGTNGKGATLAMTASILTAAGYRTGRYTSPEVFDAREKYVIDGEMISPETFAAGVTHIRTIIEQMQAEHMAIPTVFEVETALAFWYFAEQHCDIVALETGMGGAEDATNVVSTTLVSVITSIGLDHTRFLGDTVQKIAAVKGGIIKPNTEVICQNQSEEVLEVIRSIAEIRNCHDTVTQPELLAIDAQTLDGQSFCYRDISDLFLPLAGRYQLDNAMAAIDTVLALRKYGYQLPDSAIREGLRQVRWPGRFERIGTAPDFIIDGAHNPNAMQRLLDCIKFYFTNRRLVYIMGVLADKDYAQAAKLLCPLASEIYTVTPHNPRALSAQDLAACVRNVNPQVHTCEELSEAVRLAVAAAGEDGAVIAFGSLSYLAEVKQSYRQSR